jgi:hypothetical protein
MKTFDAYWESQQLQSLASRGIAFDAWHARDQEIEERLNTIRNQNRIMDQQHKEIVGLTAMLTPAADRLEYLKKLSPLYYVDRISGRIARIEWPFAEGEG